MKTNEVRRATQVLTALAVVAAVFVPMASAKAGGGSAKPKTPAGRLAALRAEAASLAKRISAVKAVDDGAATAFAAPVVPPVQQSIAPPSGPAGGVLTGTYPAPTLAPRSVDNAAIEKDAIGTGNFTNFSLTGRDFAHASIGSENVIDGIFGAAQIGSAQLGAAQLSEAFRWPPQTRGPNLSATLSPGGHSVRVASTCPNGTRVLSGGFFWKDLEGHGTEILNSSPGSLSPGENQNTWEVVAKVQSGGDTNTITPVALCIE